MDRKIIVTEDNSKTLLIPSINETYHSTHGALNEAIHVFINAGLLYIKKKSPIKIFEMGFGTGLNALVTLEQSLKNSISIIYTSVEKYPLEIETIKELNYASLIKDVDMSKAYLKMHQCNWEEKSHITPLFALTKVKTDISDYNIKEGEFDLIYYDAFGPRVQPDLWSEEVLKKMYDMIAPNGILVTYCAQGQFKRNLKKVGFIIENIPGPPGKREMTRAIKPQQ